MVCYNNCEINQSVGDGRTVILGRGRESVSALQMLVNRSMQLKHQQTQNVDANKPVTEKQSDKLPIKGK